MITALRLENFRCFKDHEIPFKARTIVVGRNNAGKSTVVEALRLVSIISDRYQNVSYSSLPRWLDLYRGTRGIAPSLDNQSFNLERVFHRHGDPPAKLTARFSTGASVEVFIGPRSELFGVVRSETGRSISSKGEAQRLDLPTVAALPQVAPVRHPEPKLTEDYVRRSLNSALAPLHFRNQILLMREHYPEFKRISEDTWSSLAVGPVRQIGREPDATVELEIRNEDFVADVSWMGHGLQMWLQTMWFLARSSGIESVILDEPDVYMHPDLQRRLIRFTRSRHPQIIIATHSVEILSETEPEDVLVLDKQKRAAQFAADWPEIQQVVAHVGGVHNIQLTRLTHARKCLMVEGEDLALLRRFHDTLFPDSSEPLQSIPVFSIGGWGGWDYVVGSSMWIEQTFSDVRIYCALDRDYHSEEQIKRRKEQAEAKGIQLVVWHKKEIENYLLVPNAIARLLRATRGNKKPPGEAAIRSQLNQIAESLKQIAVEEVASELQASDRGLVFKTAFDRAKAYIEKRWGDLDSKLSIVSGKAALSELNKWLRDSFAVSVTAGAIAQEIAQNEIAPDLQDFLRAVEFRESL